MAAFDKSWFLHIQQHNTLLTIIKRLYNYAVLVSLSGESFTGFFAYGLFLNLAKCAWEAFIGSISPKQTDNWL